jgi:osmotically-inducible protein OsmY
MGSSLAWQTDTQLHDSVQRQLQWHPEIESADIAVIASDRMITLTGVVRSYSAKLAAEQSVKRVRGVRGVANEIRVVPSSQHTDTEIAKAAVHALRARTNMPTSLTVTARDGVLILDGTVRWMFQKAAAGVAVMHLDGFTDVSNRIEVTPSASVGQVKTEIDAALHRCADIDARHVAVALDDSVVTLSGQVSSCHEKQEAERAASGAPGITRVENKIVVGLPRETRSAFH